MMQNLVGTGSLQPQVLWETVKGAGVLLLSLQGHRCAASAVKRFHLEKLLQHSAEASSTEPSVGATAPSIARSAETLHLQTMLLLDLI